MYEQICASKSKPGTLKIQHNSGRVIAPGVRKHYVFARYIDLASLAEGIGVNHEFLICSGAGSDPTLQPDRGGEHESFVVVCVFADQVYSSGRLIEAGIFPKD